MNITRTLLANIICGLAAVLIFVTLSVGAVSTKPRIQAGGQPAVTLSTTHVQFGKNGLGQQTQPQTIALTNSGTADLHIGFAGLKGSQIGEFGLTGNTCGTVVAPGATCDLMVVFAAGHTGHSACDLYIGDDAPDTPQKVLLTGYGIR